MKLLASLIITVCLALGAIAATTAYVPPVDAIRAEDALTLNAPAGRSPDDPTQPLVAAGTLLDSEVLEQLRAANVSRVRVREFAFMQWEHKLWFLGAGVGLVIGAGMLRSDARRRVEMAEHAHAEAGAPPDQLLRQVRVGVMNLVRELTTMSDETARMDAIVERLDALRMKELEQFVESRALLVSRLGMGGYAQVMDRFAAAERQLNRAWSAAADRVPVEAVRCLEDALPCLEAALARLGAKVEEPLRPPPGAGHPPR
jgi:hypothetical protein